MPLGKADHDNVALLPGLSLLARVNAATSQWSQVLRSNCSSLNASPRELVVCFYLKFGDSYAYFACSQILVLYLHQEFGISDIEAGAAYGMWGVSITFWGLACSVFNDYLGVRRAMLLGFTLSSLSYFALACATTKTFLYCVLFVILPLGNSLGIPMISIGIKRFTTTQNRGFAFAVFYAIMNLAAFISGPVIDAFTIGLSPRGLVLSTTAPRWSAIRCIILTAALSSLTSLVVTALLLKEDGGVDKDKGAAESAPQTFEERRANLWKLVTSVTFLRFSVLTLLLINLNAIFRHLDATFPTFVVRTFGTNAPKGMLYAINPLMIMLLVPLVGALTTGYKHFDMIKWGGYVTAAAPLCLAASVTIPGAIGMVILLSLGEAIWSPRTYDYTYSIAPDGQEASFAALATAPLFAAKIPVGLLSGWLLSTFCPETGPKRGDLLWLIVAVVTLTSPILITLLEKRIREPEPESSSPPVVLSEAEMPGAMGAGGLSAGGHGHGRGEGEEIEGEEFSGIELSSSSSHNLL